MGNVVISLCTTLKIFMLEAISPGPKIRNSLALCVYCTKAPIFHYNAVRVMIQTMIFYENSFNDELGTTYQRQLIRTLMESNALKSSTMFILYYIKFKEILAAMRESVIIL